MHNKLLFTSFHIFSHTCCCGLWEELLRDLELLLLPQCVVPVPCYKNFLQVYQGRYKNLKTINTSILTLWNLQTCTSRFTLNSKAGVQTYHVHLGFVYAPRMPGVYTFIKFYLLCTTCTCGARGIVYAPWSTRHRVKIGVLHCCFMFYSKSSNFSPEWYETRRVRPYRLHEVESKGTTLTFY